MKILGVISLFLVCLVFVMLLGTGMSWWGLWFQRVSMPFQEQTRRLTYQQSATHQEGSMNNFLDLCTQFVTTNDPAAKDMIRSAIIQRKNVYAGPELSPEVQHCFSQLGL